MRTFFRASLFFLCTLGLAAPAAADATPQTLPFSQDWSNAGLITAADTWTGVPGILGYNGTGMGTSGTADPQTLLGEGSETLQVYQDHGNPDTFASGGVAEFDRTIANHVVALQGSNTNGAPNLVITITTTGLMNVVVAYNVRDIDGSSDDAVQRVALQYRIGTGGAYTNIPAGYVPDATTVSSATQVTAISATLPAACNNQAIVQIRVITANASGNDEWVGIDDISISAGPVLCGNGTTDPGEACDAGGAGGATTCGCQSNCQFGALGTMCAAAGTEPCDAPDTCDGMGVCAARVRAMGFVCNASLGMCDPAETCDGMATTCPTAALSPSGTECRPAAGACDVAETCDGIATACPTDGFASNTTPCDDGLMCNGVDVCMAGACLHAGMDCSDANACTVDACSETATPICTHTLTAAPACCSAAADCDDSDVCTTDACTSAAAGVCTYDPVANCCHDASECADSDPCTTDTCDTTSNQCMHAASCADAGTDGGTVIADAGSDGGARDGSASDATSGGSDAGAPRRSTGSCGCSSAGASRTGGAGLGLLALGLLWLGRRRRGAARLGQRRSVSSR